MGEILRQIHVRRGDREIRETSSIRENDILSLGQRARIGCENIARKSDAHTYDASTATFLGIEVENKESLPHYLKSRSNFLSGIATHQRGSLREQSSSAETVTCCKESSATTECTPIKGDIGFAAGFLGEDLGKVRDKFYG